MMVGGWGMLLAFVASVILLVARLPDIIDGYQQWKRQRRARRKP